MGWSALSLLLAMGGWSMFTRFLSRHPYFPMLGFKMITLFRREVPYNLSQGEFLASHHRSHHHMWLAKTLPTKPNTAFQAARSWRLWQEAYYGTCSNKTQTEQYPFYLGTFPEFTRHPTCLEIEPRTVFQNKYKEAN